MNYSTLGRTGLKVSRLGFGAMRLPMKGDKIDRALAIPMIHYAFEAGVNYIDTAVGYCNEDSQVVVGEALKGWRDKVIVSTKNHYYGEDEKEWWKNLENSLSRINVQCIDIYNTHGVNKKTLGESVAPRVIKWLKKAKDQGMIKHICTSFHDNADGLRAVVDSDFYDCITLQYNMLNCELEDAIAYAHDKNMGIVVMGPVGGGSLGNPSDVLSALVPGVKRVPELALRFVLSNSNVDIALSGMSTMDQVKENVGIWSDEKKLLPTEITLINEQVNRLKKIAGPGCTGCGYCKPCPQGVDIPGVLSIYNNARVYGFWEHAREQYGSWVKRESEGNRTASWCKECGECEKKCPQKIPIVEQLKDACKRLS